jgi:hypothetical protein
MREKSRKSTSRKQPPTHTFTDLRGEVRGAPSSTAVAVEALRTGVVPLASPTRPPDLPRPEEASASRNPDAVGLADAVSGEETAMGHMPSPENNEVDAMGRAMGIQEEDSGGLRTSSEILDSRDRHRAQQDLPERSRE